MTKEKFSLFSAVKNGISAAEKIVNRMKVEIRSQIGDRLTESVLRDAFYSLNGTLLSALEKYLPKNKRSWVSSIKEEINLIKDKEDNK